MSKRVRINESVQYEESDSLSHDSNNKLQGINEKLDAKKRTETVHLARRTDSLQ